MLLLQGLCIVPDVEQTLLQSLGGQAGLEPQVSMARCNAPVIRRVIIRLRNAARNVVVRIQLGAIFVAQLNTWQKTQRPVRCKQTKNFYGLFIDDLDGAIILRAQRRIE